MASSRTSEGVDHACQPLSNLPHHHRWLDDEGSMKSDPTEQNQPRGDLPADLVIAWATADDAMGKCMASSTVGVPIHAGINWPATIISSVFTHTPAHIEDCLLGAVNDLVFGRPKLWMTVPGELDPNMLWNIRTCSGLDLQLCPGRSCFTKPRGVQS